MVKHMRTAPGRTTRRSAHVVPVLHASVAAADGALGAPHLRWTHHTPKRSTAMNTIIYIVGLIVVIGFVLSFFGLR